MIFVLKDGCLVAQIKITLHLDIYCLWNIHIFYRYFEFIITFEFSRMGSVSLRSDILYQEQG